MKRIAIILGSPYPATSRDHLRGVSRDVANYKKFLLSSTGGAWVDSEIRVGTHITKSDVVKIQRLCNNADLALVIFSGHGYMKNDNNYIKINPYQSINIESLNTTAKCQITISDACRTDHSIEHLQGIGDLGIHFDYTRPDIARELFDDYIETSPYGRYTIFSSSKGKSSVDTEFGGRFTLSLLETVNSWSYEANDFCMTADEAFIRVSDDLKYGNPRQTPQAFYQSNDGFMPTLPFGISTRAYIRRYDLPTTRTRNLLQHF